MKYVYACITYKCHIDMDEAKKTKKYQKAAEVANALGIENIVVDICTSRNRHKHNLEQILQTEGNVVVVSDVSALGQKNEVADVYRRIIQTGNDILITYFGKGGVLEDNELSSATLSFTKKQTLSLEQVIARLDGQSNFEFLSNSRKTVDPRIAAAYWQIEKGEKNQVEAIEEIGTSKSTFIRRVDEYIGSDDWVAGYLKALEDDNFLNTPNKLGGISDDAKKLYEHIRTNPEDFDNYPLEVAVSFAGIDLDTWDRISELSIKEDAASKEEADRLSTRYYVNAHHLYRQTIKYDKYLKQLKYRQ